MKYLILIAALIAGTANAQNNPAYLLKLENLDVLYTQFKSNRDPYTPEYNGMYKYRIGVDFQVSLAHLIYWKNYVHTEAVTSEVKTVGWHYVVGMRIHPSVDIFYEHHSRHIMEDARPKVDGLNVFPVEDSFGVKLNFFRDDKRTYLFQGD